MKKICEFCKKEYDWEEGQPKWVKPNSDMKPIDRNAIRSDKFCCYQCGMANRANKIKQTNLIKYGRENVGQIGSPEHQKIMREKYNTNFPMSNQKIKEKTKQTFLNRYGVDNPSKLIQTKEKVKTTKKKHYGNENYINIEQIKRIKKEKYKDENYNNRKKCKQTKLEHWGDKNYSNREKTNQTTLNRYGVTNSMKNEQTKDKVKKTNQIKYGGNCPMCSKNVREKSKQTMLKKYNVEYASQSPEIRQKIYATKKRNHTFNTSKPEEEILRLLSEKYPDVKSQYKSQVYPFACDFYIPSLDLYIEFQGFWVHGKEAYDERKEEHRGIVEEWRSRGSAQYEKAIETWTIRDPMKRKVAKEGGLNWVEFFTFGDFMEWYRKH